MTKAQIEGRATPEPASIGSGLLGREGAGVRGALESFVEDSLGRNGRALDLLDRGPVREGEHLTAMRTDAQGAQSLQRLREPFQMRGEIVSADADRVTQSIGRGQTFTYKTDDLLQATPNRDGALRALEQAAVKHEVTDLKLGSRGLEMTTQSEERGKPFEHGR